MYGIILAVLFAGEAKILNKGFYTGAIIIMITVLVHTIYKFRMEKNKKAIERIGFPE